jgi:hypothetical protein
LDFLDVVDLPSSYTDPAVYFAPDEVVVHKFFGDTQDMVQKRSANLRKLEEQRARRSAAKHCNRLAAEDGNFYRQQLQSKMDLVDTFTARVNRWINTRRPTDLRMEAYVAQSQIPKQQKGMPW